MSTSATSRTKPQSEADRRYSALRHKKAAQCWRANGRNVSATARQFAVDRSTVQDWRDREQWNAWADAADGRVAEKIQQTHETALSKHLREAEQMLANQRVINMMQQRALIERQMAGHSVDELEVQALARAIKTTIDAGAVHFNLKTLNVNHSGEVSITGDEVERIRQSLSAKVPWLSDWRYEGSEEPEATA